jgi:uncharacterized DUF497 family protein
MDFEWDPAKDEINRKKHGISFSLAQYAFSDPRRIITLDRLHSTDGEKGRRRMKNKTKYSKAPKDIAQAISASEIIEDFLPAPDRLVFKEEAVKVTLSLGKESVRFFKKIAKENHVPYQNMIKRVVDLYARHYMQPGS